MDDLTMIEAVIKQRGCPKVERINDPDGTWSYLRWRLSSHLAITLDPEPDGTYTAALIDATGPRPKVTKSARLNPVSSVVTLSSRSLSRHDR